MYKNIGKKIKIYAIVLAIIIAVMFVAAGIVAIIMGIVGYYDSNLYSYDQFIEMIVSGIVSIVIGPIISWISSFILYGFGQLIDSNQKVADNTQIILDKLNSSQITPHATPASEK